MAPGVGFEPTAKWLTATCSTAELPGSILFSKKPKIKTKKLTKDLNRRPDESG